jgi:hypothetical protein
MNTFFKVFSGMVVMTVCQPYLFSNAITRLDFTSHTTTVDVDASVSSDNYHKSKMSFDFVPDKSTVTTGVDSSLGDGDEGEGMGDEKTRYLVLYLNTLGFANRIRSVADFYTIAVYSGRTLLLAWQPSQDCNVTFTDLFQSGPEHFKVLTTFIPSNHQEARKYVKAKALQNNLTFADYDDYVNDNDSRYFSSPILFDSDVDVIFTNYWGSTALHHLPCQHFMITKSSFYQSLVPVDDVKRVVNEVKSKFIGKVMIGVHVRGFDAKYDWAVGEWMTIHCFITAIVSYFGWGGVYWHT